METLDTIRKNLGIDKPEIFTGNAEISLSSPTAMKESFSLDLSSESTQANSRPPCTIFVLNRNGFKVCPCL
ncbi:hypothetical protein L204_105296 [Cryptococcus depauperatus]